MWIKIDEILYNFENIHRIEINKRDEIFDLFIRDEKNSEIIFQGSKKECLDKYLLIQNGILKDKKLIDLDE